MQQLSKSQNLPGHPMIDYLPTALWISFASSQVTLVAIWAALGYATFSWRAGVAAILSTVAGACLSFGTGGGVRQINSYCCAWMVTAAMTGIFLILRARRWRLGSIRVNSSSTASPTQFKLIELILLLSAFAVLAAVGRLGLQEMTFHDLVGLILEGGVSAAGLAPLAMTSLWASLSVHTGPAKFGLLAIVSMAYVGLMFRVLDGGDVGLEWALPVINYVFGVTITLLIMRMLGLRLAKQTSGTWPTDQRKGTPPE